MKKTLTRDTQDALLGGVVAGLANYFEHDTTLWRLGAVLALVFTGVFPLALAYLIMWIITPSDTGASSATYVVNE